MGEIANAVKAGRVAGVERAETILVYLWALQDAPGPIDRMVLPLAQDYADEVGLDASAISDKPDTVFARHEKGKPYFPSMPDLCFSPSHSGFYAACAFHRRPVGLDLQMHSDRDMEKIARRFFHPDEYAYLKKTGFGDFFRVWAAKESYLKYTGDGISAGLRHFAVADEQGLKDHMGTHGGDVQFCHWDLPPGYSMCLCAQRIPGVRLLPFYEAGSGYRANTVSIQTLVER